MAHALRVAAIDVVVQCIKELELHDDYEAAFVFGSAARGDITENSDLDVMVILTEDNSTIDILHPVINGVKLDLSFLSYDQLLQRTKKEIGLIPQRLPIIADSVIVFDKKGRTNSLREHYLHIRPPQFPLEEYDQQRFLLFHANDKVERNINASVPTALLSMHIGINEVLKIHYGLQGKWWLSNKRLLSDIASWDPALVPLLENFLQTQEVGEKFGYWSQILDHVARPLGSYSNISATKELSVPSKLGLSRLGLNV